MRSLVEVTEFVNRTKPDQCPNGLHFLLTKCNELNPKVYVETGCAKLHTFSLFRELLPSDGFCLGVDVKEYETWPDYINRWTRDKGADVSLNQMGTNTDVLQNLQGREIDFLFIDGDHHIEAVEDDWNQWSPYVRKGGIVAFHDWDPPAVGGASHEHQGAAILTKKLQEQYGYQIHPVPSTFIGTAYLYKK